MFYAQPVCKAVSFSALYRGHCRWDHMDIIVADTIRISRPYHPQNVVLERSKNPEASPGLLDSVRKTVSCLFLLSPFGKFTFHPLSVSCSVKLFLVHCLCGTVVSVVTFSFRWFRSTHGCSHTVQRPLISPRLFGQCTLNIYLPFTFYLFGCCLSVCLSVSMSPF